MLKTLLLCGLALVAAASTADALAWRTSSNGDETIERAIVVLAREFSSPLRSLLFTSRRLFPPFFLPVDR
jgi:hypothetical protein